MEECDLLKERLQAITEKHRIQEDIRQKKLELDQEKLKLQHLKKKSLREQWLLKDSAVHNAADSTQQQSLLCDQQQTRALQLRIHKIEMEVESLEREESTISTNETFILNRLRAVEKSSEDIIKEAQDSFVPEPLQVTTVIPDVPECLSPPANTYSETNTRKTLFAMEINVTKDTLTGESTVLSTATVPPEELNQHTGLKVYDDGRKCVYALNAPEGSHDQSCVSELSANEVEQLLRSATVHRQEKHQTRHQNPSRREERCFYNHQAGRDRENLRNHRGHYGNCVIRENRAEKDFSCRENWPRKPHEDPRYLHQESHYSRQKDRNNQSNLRERHRLGNHNGLCHHYNNQIDHHDNSYQVRNCHSVQENRPVSHHTNIRGSSRINRSRSNGFTSLRSHDQEVVTAHQPQLCYTPANYIPLNDYISVEEEELYRYNPPSYQPYSQTENSLKQSTAVYRGPTHCDRVPSPLYGDDTPYTILNALDTTEPITAIFMGFQTAQDDSGQVQEFEGSLKAELVIIEDTEDNCDNSSMKQKKSHVQGPMGASTNGNVGLLEGVGDRRTEKRVGPGVEED
ncbi:palmdelphin isoform X2 [Stegastes partitus]|uniref:Palmdelphin n=2 Tax=Stegastes partitus TaxID=144197 RepID=A0A9Y4NHW8_9TELE|nr:PREDICTED: palmdelphin isoform X2 [Stegastes partitus]